MQLLVHDFGGYSFPIQLSRALAARNHHVTHFFSDGLPGPKGSLSRQARDPAQLTICPLPLSRNFRKYSPVRRFTSQRSYARALCDAIELKRPDAVLSGNTPIDIQAELLWFCRRRKVAFVHWVQDVYSEAVSFFLKKKFRLKAPVFSAPFQKLERSVAARSHSVVVISPDFKALLQSWGIRGEHISVLENWSTLDEVRCLPRENSWAREQGFSDKPVLLYSGTLGYKHHPELLYTLAKTLKDECQVVVISEGVGSDFLATQPKLENLILLPFQPYERLSEVLAAADVLLATLETEAGRFAVPSKLLTYHCAGRPMLLAAPRTNLTYALMERSGGGICVEPTNTEAYIEAARHLIRDRPRRTSMGLQARAYAESTFDIETIASSFETVFQHARTRVGVH